MDVALGVREWYRLWRSTGSGGLDSYTNVSSESEESASSTALATLASNISAFEEAGRLLVSILLIVEMLKLGLRAECIDCLVGVLAPLLSEGGVYDPWPFVHSGDRAVPAG